MGLYRRGKTYWLTVVTEGRRIQQSAGTSNKKLAEAIYGKILTEIQEGRYFDNVLAKTKTFDEMMQRYFSECANKASTVARKRDALAHLEKTYAGYTLNRITSDTVVEYVQARRRNHAADSTILSEVRLLSNAFNVAIGTWRWCKQNPVTGLKLGLKAGKVDRWLTIEEEKELLDAARGKMRGQLIDIIVLGINSGLSQEEIIKLKPENVDLNRRTVTSMREKTQTIRTIPLNELAYAVLEKRCRLKGPCGYVFYNLAGKQLDRWRLKTRFNEAVKKSGIPHFRFHDMRHTCATWMLHRGTDLYKVSKVLGHKDISTTMRYAHHCTESLRDAVEVLEDGHKMVTVEAASGR